ncbi:hypothetical protein [Prosthecobacter sp.]|uniref:hypothetical protein n=1 Tax=Prosthecobacter sp. TaxID=1965333 RepID=UPI003784A554
MIFIFAAGCLFLLYLLWTPPLKTTRVSDPPVSQPPAPEHSRGDYSEASVMRDQCRKIISALRDFHTHQHGFPLPAGTAPDEKTAFPIDNAMVAAVSGADAGLNSAQVNYFKTWELSPKTLLELKAGRFFVSFDFNGDGRIPSPVAPDKNVQQDVLVWHAGKDGDPTTWGDNVFAWTAE